MTAFKSDLLRMLSERGFIHQISDPEGLDELAARRADHRLYRLRLHGAELPCRQPRVDHDAALAAEDRPPADRADGRRHDPRRRPVRQGRGAQAPHLRGDRGQQGQPQADLRPLPRLRRRRRPARIMVDNAEWLAPLNYIDFLREVGRHFSVNRMLPWIRSSSGSSASTSCRSSNSTTWSCRPTTSSSSPAATAASLQIGGSDQWGNIVNGIDLGRRMGLPQLYALTCPLITTSSGAKMGKTATAPSGSTPTCSRPTSTGSSGGTPRTPMSAASSSSSPSCRSTRSRASRRSQGAEINEAKKVLATEATALLHGREAADEAAEAARRTFEEGGLAEALPTIEVPLAELSAGIGRRSRCSCAPVSPPRTARCAAPSPTMRCSVNDVARDRSPPPRSQPPTSRPTAWSSCRSAARSTCCSRG